jgi:hypothetical protein
MVLVVLLVFSCVSSGRYSAVVCSVCYGNGKCNYCFGLGFFSNGNEKCLSCGGSGNCIACGGSGILLRSIGFSKTSQLNKKMVYALPAPQRIIEASGLKQRGIR